MIHPSETKQIRRESKRADYFKIIVLLNIDYVCVCVCVYESTHEHHCVCDYFGGGR